MAYSMPNAGTGQYQPHPWPWCQKSILTTTAQGQRFQANYWLDSDLGEDDDSGVYVPPRGWRDEPTSDSDSASDDDYISETEIAEVNADAPTGRYPSPTPSQRANEEEEELARDVAELVKAEQDAAAAYDLEKVVSIITQFYELLISMGHWPEGSLRYAPHTDPPVNEVLAAQFGYAPSAISLMQRLPYVSPELCNNEKYHIVARTRYADYTREKDLQEGRRPYPYQYIDGCPDIDPWLLPFMLPNRDGSHVILDTSLGVVRAYCTESSPPWDTVESRRYGWDLDAEVDYRRTPLVPALRYFSEIIYAYTSLSRLPITNPEQNDPKEKRYPTRWLADQGRETRETLVTLYRECGWPDEWRRAEFCAKWEVQEKEIAARAREAMQKEEPTRRSSRRPRQ
ncbi:hypothetical protein C8R47DRAFT_1112550 [Mycena vitilis]|nr:hypothetical protein C8R47DRAFT_1112550 [Mycena vitilis]